MSVNGRKACAVSVAGQGKQISPQPPVADRSPKAKPKPGTISMVLPISMSNGTRLADALFEERFYSNGLVNDSESIQQKYD